MVVLSVDDDESVLLVELLTEVGQPLRRRVLRRLVVVQRLLQQRKLQLLRVEQSHGVTLQLSGGNNGVGNVDA